MGFLTRRRKRLASMGRRGSRAETDSEDPGRRLLGRDAAPSARRPPPAPPAAGARAAPPSPPRRLDPAAACDPDCDEGTLWRIARERPDLRRWLVANPRADAALLEFVAQAGGPGVRQALLVLIETLDEGRAGNGRGQGGHGDRIATNGDGNVERKRSGQ